MRRENESTGADLCLSARADVLQSVRQLGLWHRELATLLGIELDDLFPRGIELQIQASPGGVFTSYATDLGPLQANRTPLVVMGAFPDWTPAQGLNRAVYTHELGHVIFLAVNPKLPPLFQQLKDIELLWEGISDLVAYESAGAALSTSLELPGCAGKVREILEIQSFAYPAEYFRKRFTSRRLRACCDYLGSRVLHTPESRGVCQQVQRGSPLPPLDRRPFTPELYAQEPEAYDLHQLGLPLNAFFRALAKESKRPVARAWLGALRTGRLDPRTRRTFACRIPKLEASVKARHVELSSLQGFLSLLRDELTATERAAFDRLERKHELDKGYRLSNLILTARASQGLRNRLLAEEFPEGARGASKRRAAIASGCFVGTVDPAGWQSEKEGCALECQELPGT